MRTLKLLLFGLCVFLVLSASVMAAPQTQVIPTIYYVKPSASGNCSSWAYACDLQIALFNAKAGELIWVAAGTYKPSSSNREATFQLKSAVEIYGGFPEAGGDWSVRDSFAHLTILSGEIGVLTTSTDNSYHVVTGSGVDNSAILDGFVISSGYANGSAPHNNGGGMYNSAGHPSISNVTFIGNIATEFGGALYNSDSNPVLTHVTFVNNKADGFTTGSCGGGIYNLNSNPTLTDVTFSTNIATHHGGGIFNLNSNPTITNVTFTGNKADGTNQSTGGGMYNSGSHPTLTDVTFANNTAYLFGDNGAGGMFNFESNPTLTSVTFTGNSASRGGGMTNKASSPSLSNVTFLSNSAYANGGGMYNLSNSSPTLSNVTFSGNRVYGYTSSSGGGMYNASSNPTLTNVTFTNNLARMETSQSYCEGGGMFNNASNPTLTTVTFSNNSAGRGGGMYNSGSSPLLTDVTFTGNSATGTNAQYGGGGMYNSGGSPHLTNVTFTGNTASRGGGIYDNSNSVMKRVTLSGNSTGTNGGGGGMNVAGGSPNLTDVILTQNSAGYGGGMLIESGSSKLMNILFSANTATYHGGGIYNYSTPSLTDVTFSGNIAAFGGGLFNSQSTANPNLTNVTFYNNTATYSGGGGGISHWGGNSSTITNSIFWGNTPDQISPTFSTITYSLIQGGWTGEGNISTNPNLVSLANNGGFSQTHALPAGSSAIDTGSPTVCPVVDQRGYTRPIDGDLVSGPRCDMGAYEYASTPAAFTLSVPLVGGGTVTKHPDKTTYGWGEEVLLTASDGPDWRFSGWSGDATGNVNPLKITMYNNTTITASFWLDAWTISTSVTPISSGEVSREPNQPTYHIGDEVTLTPIPIPGWSFAGWSGDAGGTDNPLILTVTKNVSVIANFTQDEYSLSVEANPSDKGSVAITSPKPFYRYGDKVTLTPTSTVTGWRFVDWSGDATGSANPLEYTIIGNTSITANFSDQYTLTVTPIGSGTVTLDPKKTTYQYNEIVTLTPLPQPGWSFTNWGGAASGSDNPLSVTILGDTSITSTFVKDRLDIFLPLVVK